VRHSLQVGYESNNFARARNCSFKLKTLFVSAGVNIYTWLPRQTDLRFLGILSSPWTLDVGSFNFFKSLVAATPLTDPLVIGIYSQAGLNCVTAFPAFSELWDARLLARSLDSVPGRSASDVNIFQIYVWSLGEEASLRNAISSIAHYFPAVTDLQLFVRNRDIHIVRLLHPVLVQCLLLTVRVCSTLKQSPAYFLCYQALHCCMSSSGYTKIATNLANTSNNDMSSHGRGRPSLPN
jgi:hypothetical protein